MFKKIIKYSIITLFAIVISKWIILDFLPVSHKTNIKQKYKTSVQKEKKRIKEIKLQINYSDISKDIELEYENAKDDINKYINEQINIQRDNCYDELSKDDGFLDWIFGYFTGYKMMWKKAKGFFGSDDNEIKMVSDKFQKDVMNPRFNTTITNIQEYSKNRINDYYKNVITITIVHINNKIKELKSQGYTNIKIEKDTIPWSEYVTLSASDGFSIAELTGVTSVSVVAGKIVGAKIAALLGPKMLALLSAKTATVVAGKIASSFELLFAPIVDLAINEGTKMYKYDGTKKDFEKMIDSILKDNQGEINYNVQQALNKTKNSIYIELNKKTIIKGVKKDA